MNLGKIGNVKKQQEEYKGWLVGQFYPTDSPFHDENVEICLKTIPTGDKSDKLHLHPQGREYLIVLGGRANMKLGDKLINLEKGDYIAIPNNTPDQLIEIFEDFTFIGVRYPSIPNNKVLVEE